MGNYLTSQERGKPIGLVRDSVCLHVSVRTDTERKNMLFLVEGRLDSHIQLKPHLPPTVCVWGSKVGG